MALRMGMHNPALNSMRRASGGADVSDGATYRGVALKTAYFAAVAFAVAAVILSLFYSMFKSVYTAAALGLTPDAADVSRLFGLLIGALIGGLVLTLIGTLGCVFARRAAPVFGTLYALGEGALIGVSSGFAEFAAPGVVVAALLATFVVFGVMLTLYSTGIVKVGQRFRSFLFAALISAVIFSFLFMLLALFVPSLNALATGGNPLFLILSIVISAVMVILASLYILYDLSLIQESVEAGLDKSYEWYGAFALTVTLLWLYMEMLRLFLRLAALFGRTRR